MYSDIGRIKIIHNTNEKKENAQDSIATHGDDSTDQNSDEVS